MIYYIIPARKGSKGFPGKNRKLLPFTLDSIPDQNKSSVIVSTDDEFIVDMLKNSSVKIHNRSETVSSDTASTRDLLLEVAKDFDMKAEDEIIMMYLPYPERTYDDIETQNIIKLINKHLPATIRMDYLRMMSDVYVTKQRKDEILDVIWDILEEYGYDEEG